MGLFQMRICEWFIVFQSFCDVKQVTSISIELGVKVDMNIVDVEVDLRKEKKIICSIEHSSQ